MLEFLAVKEKLSASLVLSERPHPDEHTTQTTDGRSLWHILPDGTKHGKYYEKTHEELPVTTEKTFRMGLLHGPYSFFDERRKKRIEGKFRDGKPHSLFFFSRGCTAFYEHGKMVTHECQGGTCELMCSRTETKSRICWTWGEDSLLAEQWSIREGEYTEKTWMRYSCLEEVERTQLEIPPNFIGTYFNPFFGVEKTRLIARVYEDVGGIHTSPDGWHVPYFLY